MPDSIPSVPRWPPSRPQREPAFNIAPGVLGLAVVLLGIHALRVWVLSEDADNWVVVAFAFIPAREFASAADLVGVPGGDLARIWSPLTYAFLHADWVHVGVNLLWMVAFGSPLAWRFGTVRFLIFSAVGAIAGALFHWALFSGDTTPLVGASAAISAHMAGVSRFAFSTPGGMFGAGRATSDLPAPPLSETIRNPRVLMFVGAWFASNLIFGFTGLGAGVESGAIAWDAHIGGFLAGLVLFSLFDRKG